MKGQSEEDCSRYEPICENRSDAIRIEVELYLWTSLAVEPDVLGRKRRK